MEKEIDLPQVLFYMLLDNSEVNISEIRDLKYKIEKETGRFLDMTRDNMICKCHEDYYMKWEDHHVKRIKTPVNIYNMEFFKDRFGFYDKDVIKALKKHYPLSKSVQKKSPENYQYFCSIESSLNEKALCNIDIVVDGWKVGTIKKVMKQS